MIKKIKQNTYQKYNETIRLHFNHSTHAAPALLSFHCWISRVHWPVANPESPGTPVLALTGSLGVPMQESKVSFNIKARLIVLRVIRFLLRICLIIARACLHKDYLTRFTNLIGNKLSWTENDTLVIFLT